MAEIKKLDQATILKLAAGEIIDRPVAIVKELIENAIDAKASTIAIDLIQGGIAEICIVDNGVGIANDQLPLTIEAHATSKLVDFDDLSDVLTMGFRGEALASMAAVADVTIHSWNGEDDCGAQLMAPAGEEAQVTPAARERGTTITVAHLFKKIPVRFRFLKSAASEATLITKLVQQMSLHYPHIAFRLSNNQSQLFATTGSGQRSATFCQALSIPASDALSFEKQTQDIQVSGVITSPNHTVKQRSKCWFSVNGRLVKSPVFLKAVDMALADAIPKGHYPALVCEITCPTADVDINIHPKKEDVKFTNPDQVFVAIKRAIQSAILAPAAPWQRIQPEAPTSNTNVPIQSTSSATPTPLSSTTPVPNNAPIMPQASPTVSSTALPLSVTNDTGEHAPPKVVRPTVPTMATLQPTAKAPREWVTLNKKYIIVPMGSDLLIFDQHAVHERILYDQFSNDVANQAVVSLPLLIPEYIELTNQNRDNILALLPALQRLGIDIDEFDDQQLIIREVPQQLSKLNIPQWLGEWGNTDELGELLAAAEDQQIQRLQLKACKAAVKSGQQLHDAEIEALINAAVNTDQSFTCPHGRPLYKVMTEAALDALFLRS